jgi:TonB family protein
MRLERFMMEFVVCGECPPPPPRAPYVAPPSLVKEFQRDRDQAARNPVVGPAPVGGWEFDQPPAIPYPDDAKRARIEGTVVIDGQIGADGFLADLVVRSGDPVLANAALAVLREQQWEPARVRGNAVAVPMHATFRYALQPPR